MTDAFIHRHPHHYTLTIVSLQISIVIVIKSFRGKATAAIFSGLFVRHLSHGIQRRARAKLQQLDHAQTLDDLRIPPANMLEILKDDRAGQYSIRVNRQWRICFAWHDGDAFDAEIVDYH